MKIGFHMNDGCKTIIIEKVDVYDYRFHFCIDNFIYQTRETDSESRYIKHLSKEYYFEEVDNPEEYLEILRKCTSEVFRCSES